MTEKNKSKIGSRKFLIVVWACAIFTFWGTYSLMKSISPPWMAGAMALLAGIPAGYVAIRSARQKVSEMGGS